MRQNIFLHFLNRDSREIFGLFRSHEGRSHTAIIRRSLNASILLCEDFCIIPPGFAVEDSIAFDLLEDCQSYLQERLIRLPMRESSLGDYAEKKRQEYSPMRDRYAGLFDDRRLEFLQANAQGIVPRKSKIGAEIVAGWEEAADEPKKIWRPVKKLLSASAVESVRAIPQELADRGTAVTWSAIEPALTAEAAIAGRELRNSLQNIYFSQYCREFGLVALSGIPFMQSNFGLPSNPKVYDYVRLSSFLASLGIRDVLLSAPADFIVELRRKSGFIALMDAYQQLAGSVDTEADLTYAISVARGGVTFDWDSYGIRLNPLVAIPTFFDVIELADGMTELAKALTARYGLAKREDSKKRVRASVGGANKLAEVVFFVALEEELNVLVKSWGLARHTTQPAASGKLRGRSIAVLCPMTMGRVAAAVEVATYLAMRESAKPRLLVVLGLAGGFEENDTSVGHILAGTTIVDLAMRKVAESEGEPNTNFRRRDYVLTDSIYRTVRSEHFDVPGWQAKAIEDAAWPEDRRPSLHSGLIASVDEVVASDNWRRTLLTQSSKLLGVEMEAGGACAAAERFGVPVAVLRAVSDSADPSKADTSWRLRGMKTLSTLFDQLNFDEVLSTIPR